MPERTVNGRTADTPSHRMEAHPRIPGLIYIPGFLSPREQANMLGAIDREPWRNDLQRAVQHYGWKYEYTKRTVTRDMQIGPLPEWVMPTAARIGELENGSSGEPLFPTTPEQVIVNQYRPGEGISWHTDAASFGPVIATLSLGDRWHMVMRPGYNGTPEQLMLGKGSLLIFSGEARTKWAHCIDRRVRAEQSPGEKPRLRRRRVSVTFRTVPDVA